MSQARDQIINWFNINKLNCNSNKTQQLKLKSKSKHCAPFRNDNIGFPNGAKLYWNFHIDITAKELSKYIIIFWKPLP